jgi:3-phosphoshikimate 1-carboxyvinyltransferase
MPGDKSVAHRAVLFNCLAEGVATVTGLPDGEDVHSTIRAMRALGCVVEESAAAGEVRIVGSAMKLSPPAETIDCGNSGTTMRLLMGVLAGSDIMASLSGDASLTRRPMERVAVVLRTLGAKIETIDGTPPVSITGCRLTAQRIETNVASAQVKSAALLAGLRAEGTTLVVEPQPTRDHTERMLAAMGVALRTSHEGIAIEGPSVPRAVDIDVCGDASSAAFFAVAATLVDGADIVVRNICANPGRIGFVQVLRRMGADMELSNQRDVAGEPVADLRVRSARLRATEIGGSEIPACIDELPVLAVAASSAEGTTIIRDAGELRVKESDRIATVATMLSRMGATIDEREDGLRIEGGALRGHCTIEAAGDHRIAMSAAVAALAAQGPVTIAGAQVAAVSFPDFYEMLESLETKDGS